MQGGMDKVDAVRLGRAGDTREFGWWVTRGDATKPKTCSKVGWTVGRSGECTFKFPPTIPRFLPLPTECGLRGTIRIFSQIVDASDEAL